MRSTQRNTLTRGSASGGSGSSIRVKLGTVWAMSDCVNQTPRSWMRTYGAWFQPYSPVMLSATPPPRQDANSAPVHQACAWDTGSQRKGFTLATEAIISKAASADTKRLPAYLALLGGIVCIAWSAIFVRWTDIRCPASAF